MEDDSFQTDPVLIRAAGYPYDITETSFTFINGEASPFDPSLREGRVPVIGYGSNQSPLRLRQKYGTDHAPIPVQRAELADHDVVYSAHFSSYGSLPAALRHVEGTTVAVAVNWLDEQQLETMHPSERDHYHYAHLRGISLRLAEGEELTEAYAYLSFRGHAAHQGEPIALSEIKAQNRRLQTFGQLAAISLMRDQLAPDTDLARFVHDHIANEDIRANRVQQLVANAVAVRHADHEVVIAGLA